MISHGLLHPGWPESLQRAPWETWLEALTLVQICIKQLKFSVLFEDQALVTFSLLGANYLTETTWGHKDLFLLPVSENIVCFSREGCGRRVWPLHFILWSTRKERTNITWKQKQHIQKHVPNALPLPRRVSFMDKVSNRGPPFGCISNSDHNRTNPYVQQQN